MTEDPLSKPDIRKANDCPPLPTNASVWDSMVYWLGLGLGSGLPRHAPGTWGTVGGTIVAIPLMSFGFMPFLIFTILSCIIGVWICGRTSKLMGGHDNPHIVWDEWAGIWITLLPFSYMGFTLQHLSQPNMQGLIIAALVIAFVLFRFFDIVKPPPIGWADKKVAGGLGIMLDDIIAGIMAAAVWLMVMFILVNYLALR